jgi:membrane-bound lytic murein transglycosylase A
MTADWLLFHRRAGLVAVAAAMLLGADAPAQAIKIGNSTFEAVDWAKIDGWAEDDHLTAFGAFMQSCKAILRNGPGNRAILRGLHEACTVAAKLTPKDSKEAREFFEQNFRPVRITPKGETAGFLTGYYEPIVDGSREPNEEFIHPLYRTPAGVSRGGKKVKAASAGGRKGKGAKSKKGKAKTAAMDQSNLIAMAAAKPVGTIVPDESVDAMAAKPAGKKRRGGRKAGSFYDRAAIEDGMLKGRKLELVWLKDPIDSFFIHIQGSARIRLPDGKLMRVNYDSQNGHPYYPVGRWLIDKGIYTREEVTMDRIRTWMTANPAEGNALRRMNKSYVFFRETGLGETEEPTGAQGVSLTPGRSLAVDKKLHIYGTPFFIQAELPIESEEPATRWRRLMIAQDTGGAIIGPARADIYYGAGEPAGLISGRFKQPGQFVMLFPKRVDPFAKTRDDEDEEDDDEADIPLPLPRPANIPQDDKPAPEAQPPNLVASATPETPLPVAKPAAIKSNGNATASVKPAEAKPAEKPAAKKKPAGKKETQKKPARSIQPAPPG